MCARTIAVGFVTSAMGCAFAHDAWDKTWSRSWRPTTLGWEVCSPIFNTVATVKACSTKSSSMAFKHICGSLCSQMSTCSPSSHFTWGASQQQRASMVPKSEWSLLTFPKHRVSEALSNSNRSSRMVRRRPARNLKIAIVFRTANKRWSWWVIRILATWPSWRNYSSMAWWHKPAKILNFKSQRLKLQPAKILKNKKESTTNQQKHKEESRGLQPENQTNPLSYSPLILTNLAFWWKRVGKASKPPKRRRWTWTWIWFEAMVRSENFSIVTLNCAETSINASKNT